MGLRGQPQVPLAVAGTQTVGLARSVRRSGGTRGLRATTETARRPRRRSGPVRGADLPRPGGGPTGGWTSPPEVCTVPPRSCWTPPTNSSDWPPRRPTPVPCRGVPAPSVARPCGPPGGPTRFTCPQKFSGRGWTCRPPYTAEVEARRTRRGGRGPPCPWPGRDRAGCRGRPSSSSRSPASGSGPARRVQHGVDRAGHVHEVRHVARAVRCRRGRRGRTRRRARPPALDRAGRAWPGCGSRAY
jgi:hypothetical protein